MPGKANLDWCPRGLLTDMWLYEISARESQALRRAFLLNLGYGLLAEDSGVAATASPKAQLLGLQCLVVFQFSGRVNHAFEALSIRRHSYVHFLAPGGFGLPSCRARENSRRDEL